MDRSSDENGQEFPQTTMFADTLPSVGSRLESLERLEVCAGEEEEESQREEDRSHVHDKERG